jgi:hypothetical protein
MTRHCPVGDKGQRFEVRWRKFNDPPSSHRVLGWAEKSSGAQQMADSWWKAPDVSRVWIVDRDNAVTVE